MLGVALVSALLIGLGSSAHADFELYISDSTTFETGDWVLYSASGALLGSGGTFTVTSISVTPTGSISWDGTLGSTGTTALWDLNVTTAQTVPLIGTVTQPQFDLNSVDTSTAAADLVYLDECDRFRFHPSTGLGRLVYRRHHGRYASGVRLSGQQQHHFCDYHSIRNPWPVYRFFQRRHVRRSRGALN